MRIYLGCPIDKSENPQKNYDEMTEVVLKAIPDALIFNPFSAYRNVNLEDPKCHDYLIHVNREALINSDLAVFMVDKTTSFGIPIELYLCATNSINSIVWHKPEGLIGAYENHFSGKIVRDEESLISELKRIKHGGV